MKALSLWQPWAALVAHGLKIVETRSWPYRGAMPQAIAIHATATWNQALYDLCRVEPFRSALETCGHPLPTWGGGRLPRPRGMDFGAVVAVVRLVDVRQTSTPGWADTLSERERAFGDYRAGRHGWFFDRVLQVVPPIFVRGNRMLWDWDAPDHLIAALGPAWLGEK